MAVLLGLPVPSPSRSRRERVLHQSIIALSKFGLDRNSFDCAARLAVLSHPGRKDTAMIETVTAFFGLISASIFLAHALDGFRSRT